MILLGTINYNRLGLGKELGTYQGITREWLYWYDEQENRYLSPEERIIQAQREGQQILILRQLNLKLGNIPLEIDQKIRQLSLNQLDDLGGELFNFSQLQDLSQWLKTQKFGE
jgi:hypothetical protein